MSDIPLPDAPDWIVHAGVAYCRGEWEERPFVAVKESGDKIGVGWTVFDGDLSEQSSVNDGFDDQPPTMKKRFTEGTEEAFREELEERETRELALG